VGRKEPVRWFTIESDTQHRYYHYLVLARAPLTYESMQSFIHTRSSTGTPIASSSSPPHLLRLAPTAFSSYENSRKSFLDA
jgi:hypothetical protein